MVQLDRAFARRELGSVRWSLMLGTAMAAILIGGLAIVTGPGFVEAVPETTPSTEVSTSTVPPSDEELPWAAYGGCQSVETEHRTDGSFASDWVYAFVEVPHGVPKSGAGYDFEATDQATGEVINSDGFATGDVTRDVDIEGIEHIAEKRLFSNQLVSGHTYDVQVVVSTQDLRLGNSGFTKFEYRFPDCTTTHLVP